MARKIKQIGNSGESPTQVRNAVIGYFLDLASYEACRIAREEGRKPDKRKWRKATDAAFDCAFKRTGAKARERA